MLAKPMTAKCFICDVCAQHERVHTPVSRYGKMLKMQIFFQKAKQTGVIIIQRVHPVKCEAISPNFGEIISRGKSPLQAG